MEGIIIELSGLPGSGKSTLLAHLDNENKDSFSLEDDFYSLVFYSRLRNVISLSYCFIGGLGAKIDFLYYCVRKAIPGAKKKAFRKVLKLFRYKGLVKMAKQGYILSEGYVQAFLEIMDFLNTSKYLDLEKIRKYVIDDIAKMNCLYFVLVSSLTETALERVSQRTETFNTVDKMSESDRQQFFVKRSVNTVLLHSWIREAPFTGRVFTIDAERSLEHNSQQLNNIMAVIKNEKR